MEGFDVNELDDVIHGRIRLGIMAYLVGAGAADFGILKAQLQATDGNLSVHLRKLEEAGIAAVFTPKDFGITDIMDRVVDEIRKANDLD